MLDCYKSRFLFFSFFVLMSLLIFVTAPMTFVPIPFLVIGHLLLSQNTFNVFNLSAPAKLMCLLMVVCFAVGTAVNRLFDLPLAL